MAAITAVAAGVSMATTAATTGASFIQASKQKKLQAKAERDAKKAIAEAKGLLEVNPYKALAVDMTPYEREREALLSAGAQVLEATREGEQRGVGAGAGKVLASQLKAQQDVTTAQSKELAKLKKLTAQEEAVLRKEKTTLAKEEAEGAQLAAKDAQQARAQSIQQGMEGVTSLVGQGLKAMPLYGNPWGGDAQSSDELKDYYNFLNQFNPQPTTEG